MPAKSDFLSSSKIGQEGEIREEYDVAYEAYRHAHELKPEDIRYKTFFERMRLQAVARTPITQP